MGQNLHHIQKILFKNPIQSNHHESLETRSSRGRRSHDHLTETTTTSRRPRSSRRQENVETATKSLAKRTQRRPEGTETCRTRTARGRSPRPQGRLECA